MITSLGGVLGGLLLLLVVLWRLASQDRRIQALEERLGRMEPGAESRLDTAAESEKGAS